MRFAAFCACILALAAPVAAQQGASLSELATTPVVTVRIGESLRAPPDQATINVTAQPRAATAAAAFAANKVKPKPCWRRLRLRVSAFQTSRLME